MGFQKSEYKDGYEEFQNELAYEYDRPIHQNKYLIHDENKMKGTEVT
jgi:hypothetical protein